MNPVELVQDALREPRLSHDPALRLRGGLRLRELVPGLEVRLDDDTPTLSIEATASGHLLRIGPAFCRQYVRTREDARLVIAHELLHVARGHLTLPRERHPGLNSLQNIAMDILVNAAALSWFVGGASQPGLFRRLYPATAFPGCLLLPPADLVALVAEGSVPDELELPLAVMRSVAARDPSLRQGLENLVESHLRRLEVRQAGAFAREYVRGYFDFPEPMGFWERMKALFITEFGIDPEPCHVPLLGDHCDRPRGTPMPGGLAGSLEAAEAALSEVRPRTPSPAVVDQFCRQVADALDESKDGGTTTEVRSPMTTPVPLPGRRDLPLLALGRYPGLWHPVQTRREPERKRMRVYFDVSGSMDTLAPVLFGLLRALGRRLELPVWCWSVGEPIALSGEDLEAGRFHTRGGTVFEPVITHAVEQGFERIIVLTDGIFTVAPGSAAEARAADLEITFALAGPHSIGQEDHLRGIAAGVFRLREDGSEMTPKHKEWRWHRSSRNA